GMGAAMLALAPALLEPIGMIRRLRPSVLLRRDLDPRKMERSWIAAAVAIAGFALLAARLLRSWRSAAILAGALVLVLGIAFALSVAMLRGLRRLHYPSVALRHGVAGLYRPGNRSGALIAVLATALTLMVATFELSGVVAHAVFDVLPYDRNSLYVAGFRESYREPLRAFLEKLPGVDSVEILSEARMRLLSVDGLDYAFLKGEIHTVVCDSVSSAAAGPARLMVADDRARLLKAHVGMRVDFDSHDRVVHARVAEVRKFTPAERFWSTLRLDCSGLDDAALFHQAAIHVRPEKISAVRAAIAGRYPTLAVVSADDVSETVSGVSRDAMVLTRVVAWYAIAGGWCVLIALVAASRPARLNELGILSSLGATRRAIVRIYTVEFAVVGLASAMIASILTIGFTMAGMSVIFGRIEAAVEWPVAAAAVVLSVIATIGAAWFPAAGLLRMKPMDILRRH
ncbi:MAG: hypothetical protein LAO79_28170, partial [Acidobacteriia bacterium]|nr:hypothetical protein [Terriglobia bacterium]